MISFSDENPTTGDPAMQREDAMIDALDRIGHKLDHIARNLDWIALFLLAGVVVLIAKAC